MRVKNLFAGKSISEIHVKTRRKLVGGRWMGDKGRRVIKLDKIRGIRLDKRGEFKFHELFSWQS